MAAKASAEQKQNHLQHLQKQKQRPEKQKHQLEQKHLQHQLEQKHLQQHLLLWDFATVIPGVAWYYTYGDTVSIDEGANFVASSQSIAGIYRRSLYI